ncbi:hypothetical protein GCM10009806_00030 [Microbacterium flavum]
MILRENSSHPSRKQPDDDRRTHGIDPDRFLEDHLAQASPDLLREMLGTFINQLLSADADQVCGAAYGTISDDRMNRRNGYRHRDFDTRAGTIDVKIPKLRQGTYFPEWLLERRRRAEAALTTVVATSYLFRMDAKSPVRVLQPQTVDSPSACCHPACIVCGGDARVQS